MKRLHLILALITLAMPALAGEFPKGSPKFELNYETALSEAKKTGKPVVLIFSAAWCPKCQTMKKDVYPSRAVKPYHDQFVWAYLDIDIPVNDALSDKYHVSPLPHIEFLKSSGKSLTKQTGGSDAATFAATLAEVLKKTAK